MPRLMLGRIIEGPDMHCDFMRVGVVGEGKR